MMETTHSPALPPGGRLDGYRIVVVDDNHDTADSLGLVLHLLGADVRVVYDGLDALNVLDEDPPNVLILDINMPAPNGYEVARRLRDRPQFHDLIIVALTGWAPADEERTGAAGFDHHFMKPLQTDLLFEALHQPRHHH